MSAPPSKKSKKASAPAALPGADDRRSRRLVNKPRMRSVIDPETRRQVAAARLAALEQDNWVDASESTGRGADGAYEDEADEEIEQGGGGGARKKRKSYPRASGAGAGAAAASSAAAAASALPGGKADRAAKVSSGLLSHSRLLRNLDHVVAEEGYDSDPETAPAPNYKIIAAGPSARPPRWFCSVCGFLAPYTCPRCGLRFCTLRCQQTHKETRCLKFAE